MKGSGSVRRMDRAGKCRYTLLIVRLEKSNLIFDMFRVEGYKRRRRWERRWRLGRLRSGQREISFAKNVNTN